MAWLDSNKKLCTLKFQIQKILTFFNIKKRATNLGLLYAIYPNIYIYLYLVSVEGEKGGERVSVTRQDLIVAESKVSGGQSRCIYIDWFSSMKYYIYICVCVHIFNPSLIVCLRVSFITRKRKTIPSDTSQWVKHLKCPTEPVHFCRCAWLLLKM